MIKQSLIDYPGEIAAVLFTRGCNFRCPFCHNAPLLPSKSPQQQKQVWKNAGPELKQPLGQSLNIEWILEFLQERTRFLDAVVITGGEPTIHPELFDDLRRIKQLGYLIKLDTNGTNLLMLEKLLQENLLDYAAMDIKAPLDYKKYQQASGRLSSKDFFNLRNSINLLKNTNIKVEFRTTVVPVLHSPEDILQIARYIEGANLYSLQQFNPDCTLVPAYKNVVPYSREEMQDIARACRAHIQEVRVLNI